MAAEIRLALGLDLAYFRQEMRKAINIVQSEFTGQVNVKINRQSLQRETQYLTNYFRRKNYRINVNTNLDAEILKASNLTQKLNEINGRKVPVSIQSAITNADVEQFRRDVQSKLGGIKVKIEAELGQVSRGGFAAGPAGAAGLYEYMRSQGLSGGNMPGAGGAVGVGRSERLRKALEDLSVKQLQALAKKSGITGVSRLRKDPLVSRLVSDLNQDIAENVLGNIKNQMRGEGGKIQRSFLDQIARAVMFMAGVDPEQLRREAARRRLPPAIDFPATVPSRTIPIGPSATGRALTGVTQGALPGRSIANAKYLPSDLGLELKRILRGAAYAFIDSLNERVRQVRVREIGQAQLAPSRVAGLLPAAVGRQAARYGGPGATVSQRIAQAYQRSAARGASVMAEGPQGFALGAGGSGAAGPFRQYAQPPRGGAIVPYNAALAGGPSSQLPPGYFAGGKIQQALKGADQYLKQSRVPLAGAISELAGEFGNAIKQVLLFGTAYKALAFFVNLPAQALEAARSLQSFNNQVNAITGSAANARQAISFINKSVEQFNIPLQSARDGFLKLYASMKPAGIPTDVIEGLFTGVSKASATLGLSADQVDRVTYAFSQMASKGKIMSEEVTGQLGDVIPGALSLMADAAGMSMAEFKDAMEKGQLSGAAMEQVFRNLKTVLDERFGAGAVGAADTLQGKMNDLQTAVTRMYESFEPLVDLVASSVFPQLSTLIEDATKAVEAFAMKAEGTNPALSKLSGNAQNMYNVLVQLSGIAKSIGELFQSLRGVFGLFGQTLLTLLEGFNALISNPVGQFLVRLTGFAVVANAALATLAVRFAAVSTSLKTLNLMLLTGSQRFGAIRNQMRATGATAGVLRGRILGVSTALKSAFVGTGVGLVLMGLSALAEHMSNVAQRAEEVRRKALGAAEAIRAMGRTEVAQQERQTKRAIGVLESIRGRQAPYEAQSGEEVPVSIGKEEVRILEAAGIPVQKAGFAGGGVMAKSSVEGYLQQQQGVLAEARHRKEVIKFEESESRKARAQIEKVTLGGGDGEGKGKSAKERVDMTRDMYTLNKLIREEQEKVNQLTKDANPLRLAELEYQRDILKAKESDMLATEKADAMDEAASKRRQAIFEFFKKYNKDVLKFKEEELRKQEEINRARAEYNVLLIDAQEDTGAISPNEAAQRRRDAEQLQTIERLRGILPPGEIKNLKLAFEAIPKVGSIGELKKNTKDELDDLTDRTKLLGEAANGIGRAFAKSFTDILTGAQTWREGLAGAFKSVASMFADMVAQMLAKWAALQIIGMFSPGGNSSGAKPPAKSPLPGSVALTAANGAVWEGGFTPFANGGVVKGPTLGLVGEGRFNEAVVPLPDGKKIPVELGDGAGSNISTNIVVNINNGQASSQINGSGGQSLGRELEGAVRGVILKESRPGGIIYNQR